MPCLAGSWPSGDAFLGGHTVRLFGAAAAAGGPTLSCPGPSVRDCGEGSVLTVPPAPPVQRTLPVGPLFFEDFIVRWTRRRGWGWARNGALPGLHVHLRPTPSLVGAACRVLGGGLGAASIATSLVLLFTVARPHPSSGAVERCTAGVVVPNASGAGSRRIPPGGGGEGGDAVGPGTPTTPPPPRGGLRPTVSCQRCRPRESTGAKGARRSLNTKGAQRKVLSTLHPNTIVKPNPNANAHPNPQPSPNPIPNQD